MTDQHKAIVFETPGEIDLRSMDTFGINVKKGLNPIGYFGTGLKYAIAVLLREGISMTIYIGQKTYEFYLKEDSYRGKDFKFIMLRQRSSWVGRWTSRKMPFTTEFGKNWSVWQAFRELESNTRDEGGKTFETDQELEELPIKDGRTLIVVDGAAFHQVWLERDAIFLPDALTVAEGNDQVQIFKRPSNALYYRGLKVLELEKPSKLTYNILSPVDLTEDRTVKSTYSVKQEIARYIACYCKDQQVINDIVSSKAENNWEGTFDWEYVWSTPSELFMSVIRKKLQRAQPASTRHYVAPRISSLYEKSTPQPPRIKEPVNKVVEDLAWWLGSGEVAGLPDLSALIQEACRLLTQHSDYEEVQVVMVPKTPVKVDDYGDDIPF